MRLAQGPGNRTDLSWSRDSSLLTPWVQGQTGFPYIDASMRELSSTGWVSNRGRQNVASFLTKALGVDWRLGAEIFQSLLIDHDKRVNLGNWSYVAGVGADPRDRHFRTVTQGEKYDPRGEYIATWLPELRDLPMELRHRPWERTREKRDEHEEGSDSDRDKLLNDNHKKSSLNCSSSGEGGNLSVDNYPEPILDPKTQIGKGLKKK